MNQYLALSIYIITLIHITAKLSGKNEISKHDYFMVSLSYVFFGLAWVIEKFIP